MKNLLKLVKSVLIIVGLTGTANAADLSEILSSGVVKIAVPESFPPFGSVGASGAHEGYDVDVAKLIAKDLGVKLELVPVVSKQRIPFLTSTTFSQTYNSYSTHCLTILVTLQHIGMKRSKHSQTKKGNPKWTPLIF